MFRASCCGFIGCVERNVAKTLGFIYLMEHNIIPLALYFKLCSFWACLIKRTQRQSGVSAAPGGMEASGGGP